MRLVSSAHKITTIFAYFIPADKVEVRRASLVIRLYRPNSFNVIHKGECPGIIDKSLFTVAPLGEKTNEGKTNSACCCDSLFGPRCWQKFRCINVAEVMAYGRGGKVFFVAQMDVIQMEFHSLCKGKDSLKL